MNPRILLGAAALAALAVTTSIVIRGDETPPEQGDVPLHPEKAVALRDGGTGYAREYLARDGGLVTRLVQAECVRRLADAGVTACRQRLPDGGLRDPGALNRFPADAAVGTRCQKVACGVYLGEDANEEEGVRVARQRDGGLDSGGTR